VSEDGDAGVKRLAYLTLAVEFIVMGVAGWELVTPGCGGRVDLGAIRAWGIWCARTPIFIVLFGSILFAVTLGYIAALHLNTHASLLRKVFASLNFAGSLLAATAAVMLGFGAISSFAAGRSGTFEFLALLALALLVVMTEALVGGALLGRLRAARLKIVWLGVSCSIGLGLLAAYMFISAGFSDAIAGISISALAVLFGSSVFFVRGAGTDRQTVESGLPPMRGLRSRLPQTVFVVCLIGVGARVLILEVPPLWSTFPEISDWNSLRITLERGGCLGTCPIYKVEIRGDGTVLYDGTQFVAVTGRQEDHIPVAAVRELFEQFRKTNYFAYSDVYTIVGFDVPTYTTSIAFDGRSKSVLNFDGPSVGMPRVVTDLENAIDRAANTDKWIKGS
jgi:hypothetical protein